MPLQREFAIHLFSHNFLLLRPLGTFRKPEFPKPEVPPGNAQELPDLFIVMLLEGDHQPWKLPLAIPGGRHRMQHLLCRFKMGVSQNQSNLGDPMDILGSRDYWGFYSYFGASE